MAVFTLKEILDATSGELHNFQDKGTVETYTVDGVSTDSRKIENGNLFLALIGEKFDGNKYAYSAAKDGASALLLSDMSDAPDDVPVILVKDTKLALEQLATYYRTRLHPTVIAVTGSVGKTSTREMIGRALGNCEKVYCTKQNENNEIGLSKTILETPKGTNILVLEMGMRLRGEISELTHIAWPDIAVITKIGLAHIERLGSQEEILRAKLEILEGLAEGGLLVIPYFDPMLRKAVAEGLVRPDVKIAYFTDDETELPQDAFGLASAGEVTFENDKLNFLATVGYEQRKQIPVSLSVFGVHHVGNTLAALLCGTYLGLPLDKLVQGAEMFAPIGHRERLVTVEGVHFVDDSYNAGPESMMSAMESLRRLGKNGKAYACTGDMLELGDASQEAHLSIGRAAAEQGLDGLFVIGDFKKYVEEGCHSVDPDLPVFLCEDKKDILNKLKNIVQKGDYVLLKASHSFEMYTILDEYVSIFTEGEC